MKKTLLIILLVFTIAFNGCSASVSLGSVDKNVYSNEYFDIALDSVSGMSLFPNETIKELFQIEYSDDYSSESTLHLCLMAKSLEEAEIMPRLMLQANKLEEDVDELDYAIEYNVDLNSMYNELDLSYVLIDNKAVIALKGDMSNGSDSIFTNFYFWKKNGYIILMSIVSNEEIDESKWISNIKFTE